MRKIATGLGQITPYRPWSEERKRRARIKALARLYGGASPPIEEGRRHKGSRRAAEIVEESQVNQHIKARWTPEQRQAASEKAKAQWNRRRKVRMNREEKRELVQLVTTRAETKAATKARRAAVQELRQQTIATREFLRTKLREFKVQRQEARRDGRWGALLKLDGAIAATREMLRQISQFHI